MKTQQLKERVGEKAVSLTGDTAGFVADPKAGINQIRSKVSTGPVALVAAGLTVAYLLGRRSARHG